MTIHANDIKIRASKVMADVPEGGGGPGANVIKWGQSNTMFDDVDTVSRTIGNVSIRQAFLHVDTDNTDRLLGSHAYVAKMPDDPNVAVTLAACEPFATRSQISTAIANYLIRGVPWNGLILGNHVQGQASLQIMQRPGSRVPTIGRTFAIVIDEGKPTEAVEWVRIIKVESEDRTYTDSDGDYTVQVVMCELAGAMTQAVPGTDPNRYYRLDSDAAKLRDTTTADAAQYYGAAATVDAAEIGDYNVRVSSVFGQLVPNSATQVPTLDQRPAARRVITLADSPRIIEVPVAAHTRRIKIGQENRGLSYVFQMTPRPEPGTLTVSWMGLGNRYVIEDNGNGELQGQGAGAVNYLTGSLAVTLPSLPDDGTAVVLQWAERAAFTDRSSQGADVTMPSYMIELPADAEDDRLVPGTLALEYASGGTTYNVADDGAGALTGDATGWVDYNSRHVYMTPAHMPDPASQFPVDYDTEQMVEEAISDYTAPSGADATITFELSDTPAPGTLEVSWLNEVRVNRYEVDNVWIPGGWVEGMGVQYIASAGNPIPQLRPMAVYRSGVYSARVQQTAVDAYTMRQTVRANGNNDFVGSMGSVADKTVTLATTGEVELQTYRSDYEAALDFEASKAVGVTAPRPNGGTYEPVNRYAYINRDAPITVRYRVGASNPTSHSITYTPDDVTLNLARLTTARVVPGSVQFRWMGVTYVDYEGRIYRDRTGGAPGIQSGTIDYVTGHVRMTDYVVGGAGPGDFTLQSLWTQSADWSTASLFFMTDAIPLQPGQLTINCIDAAGDTIEITADLNGNLNGDHANGTVDYQNGLVQLQFGDYVLDSSLSEDEKQEWWYDAADVGAVEPDKIWRPWPVDPTSLRYNSVSNLYLPVDPEILGLNPTRLPQDGRVPIFAKGRMVAIGHNDRLAPDTYTNGQTVQLPRSRISHVWLIDNNGQLIDEGFTATEEDLNAGKIHIDDVTEWAQPVTIEHRIQDMRQCTDVQIDGTVAFNYPLSHAFPPGTVVSSVLLFGTIFARVSNIFSQQTWDQITWRDTVEGNPAPGTYNDAAHPIKVTNAGALSERYAMRLRAGGTDFDLTGEFSGGLGSGSVNSDYKPLNPFNSSAKLFELPAAGWGSNWTVGNTLFLRLEAAMPSFACIRTVQPSQAAGTDYSFDLLAGGDIDRPPNDAQEP